jgi:hypothetical protein
MFFNRANHRLPKFPPNVAPTFRMLCGLVSQEELISLRESISLNLQDILDQSKENENIDPEAACQLADICNYLLDRYNDYPEKLKKLIIGAVRYVAISDDPFDDGTFATGFFDDMRIVNHVLEKLGIEDRYFTI